jgi:hemerythrin
MNSDKFPWSDTYLLGYTPMDETHQEFVLAVNAIMMASDADLPALLQAFLLHAEEHFSQEHEWMTDTGFPAKDCHAGEHEAVLKSVREVLGRVSQGNFAEARPLAAALADWFPSHADYMDASLAQWMSKRKLGGVPVVVRRNIVSQFEAEEPSPSLRATSI